MAVEGSLSARKPASQDVENQPLIPSPMNTTILTSMNTTDPLTSARDSQSKPTNDDPPPKPGVITSMGLKVLALLAFQNAFKNILMRFVMKDHAGFLLSTAVIVVELLKLFFSVGYIVLVLKQSPFTVVTFIRSDWKNTLLLVVPATSYSLQMTLEYIAMANIDPASFSVLVQMKMLTTALFFRTILKRRLMKKQFISLVVLTVGVMLCSMKTGEEVEDKIGNKRLGIAATLGTYFEFVFFWNGMEWNEREYKVLETDIVQYSMYLTIFLHHTLTYNTIQYNTLQYTP